MISALRQSFSSPIRFGLLPAQKQQAIVELTPKDIIEPGPDQRIHVKRQFLDTLIHTYEQTGGFAAIEHLTDVLKTPQRVRQFCLGLSEQIQVVFKQLVMSEHLHARSDLGLKTVYDRNRAKTKSIYNHIHHAHFDPPKYKMVALMDGPHIGIPNGHGNRMVADGNEILSEYPHGFPRGFGTYPHDLTPQQKQKYGIEIDSQGGSFILHSADRWMHWTGEWEGRREHDGSETPYGFFGFSPLDRSFVEELQTKKKEFARETNTFKSRVYRLNQKKLKYLQMEIERISQMKKTLEEAMQPLGLKQIDDMTTESLFKLFPVTPDPDNLPKKRKRNLRNEIMVARSGRFGPLWPNVLMSDFSEKYLTEIAGVKKTINRRRNPDSKYTFEDMVALAKLENLLKLDMRVFGRALPLIISPQVDILNQVQHEIRMLPEYQKQAKAINHSKADTVVTLKALKEIKCLYPYLQSKYRQIAELQNRVNRIETPEEKRQEMIDGVSDLPFNP